MPQRSSAVCFLVFSISALFKANWLIEILFGSSHHHDGITASKKTGVYPIVDQTHQLPISICKLSRPSTVMIRSPVIGS